MHPSSPFIFVVTISVVTRIFRSIGAIISRRQSVFGSALILIVLPFLLFWPVWWPGTETRQVFAYGDFVEQYYPMRVFAAGEWRQFRLPLWDPYTYAGTPAAAASLFAAFYPFNAWLALFPYPFPFEALELEAIFHLGLTGVFTMLLIRRWTGRTAAGLLAGTAFSLGGFLTSYPVLQLGILETAAWLPAGLWLLDGGLTWRDLRRVVLAGLAFACALLAGHPQTFLYIAYVTAACFLFRAWRLRISWQFAGASALSLLLVTAGLSAVQWLPSLELARLSPRADISFAEVSNGFTLAELWGLLRPNPGEWSPLYVGWVPLGLVVVALVLSLLPDGARCWQTACATGQADVWFWLAVAMTAMLLSLGRNGFLYPLIYGVAPGFGMFRNQERAAFLVSFALCLLAGYGLAALLNARRWSPAVLLVGPALLLALTFVDLYRTNHGLVLAPPPVEGYFPRTAIVQHLQGTGTADWRTSSEGLLPGDGNAGLVYRIRDLVGNSPLHLADYDRFLAEVPESRFWQLLNVQHLLTLRQLDHGALMPVLSDGERRLYQVFVAARPVWIVHDYRLAADASAARAVTADPDLDPLVTVVLEAPPEPQPMPAVGLEDAELIHFEPQRIVVNAELSAPGVLISSEVFYPGWVARVNGQHAPTLRAFGLLRAVALPAGQWQVEWRYEPRVVHIGLGLSLITLFVIAICLAVARPGLESGR